MDNLPASPLVAATVDNAEGPLWARNDQHDTWGDLEDAFYLEVAEATIATFTHLIDVLGLDNPGVVEYEDMGKTIRIDLLKAKGDDLAKFRYLPKAVLKYLRDGKTWSKEQLAEIERLLVAGLSRVKNVSDRYAIQAESLSALFSKFDDLRLPIPRFMMSDLPATMNARKRLPAPERDKDYKLRADKGDPEAPVLPLTNLEDEAIKWAQLHAGEKIATQNQYIKDKVRELVIQARRSRWTPGELQQALLKQLGEFNRDWRRIAITELADCMSNAYVATLLPGEWVVGQGNPSACPWCKEHIHGQVFKVVRLPGDPDTEIWVGKTNYGRKKADWVPAIPAHPNCRCRWQKFNPKFSYIDANGRVDLKTPEMILRERQALKSFFNGEDVLIKGATYKLDEDQVPTGLNWTMAETHMLGANPNQVPFLDQGKLTRMREHFNTEPMPPILIAANGTILDGHHRWYVALEMGMQWVPVVVAPVRVVQAVDEAGEKGDVGAVAKEALGDAEV